MLLPSPSVQTRDLRSSPVLAESRIGARTPLYSVVEASNPGVYGPFFYDPAVAVLFSFYRHLSVGHYHCAPVKPDVPDPPTMKRGAKIPTWLFSSGDYYLLELRSNSELVFENRFIDSNVDKYVDYKFGRHNPATLRTNVNLDPETSSADLKAFIGDQKWNDVRSPNLAFYNTLCMIDNFVFGANNWIMATDSRTIDFHSTLFNFDRYAALLSSSADKKRVVTYTHIQEVAICVVKPQEIFDERCVYTINWESVWMHFISMRAYGTPIQSIKAGFQTNPALFLERRELVSATSRILDNVVCLHLAAHCYSLRDISAFFSTCRFYRRVYLTFSMQQILLRKFLPYWTECFTVIPKQTEVERMYVLGMPICPPDQGWWNISPILFYEDIPEADASTGTAVSTELQRNEMPTTAETKPKLNIVKNYRRRIVRPEQLQELDARDKAVDDEKRLLFLGFPKLQLADHQILSVLRSCNSFLSMTSLIYTGTLATSFQELCTVGIRVDDDPPLVCSTKRTAMPPARPLSVCTAIDFFAKSPVPEYQHTVSCFSSKGTWTHPLMHPFFQDLSFIDRLTKFKKLSQYSCSLRSRLHMLSSVEVEAMRTQDKRNWVDQRLPKTLEEAFLDFRTQLILYDVSDTPVLSLLYERVDRASIWPYRMHFCFPAVDATDDTDSSAKTEIADFMNSIKQHYIYGTFDMVALSIQAWPVDSRALCIGKSIFGPDESESKRECLVMTYAPTAVAGNQADPHLRNCMFYSEYMITCCVLRWFIREKAVIRGEWRTNF